MIKSAVKSESTEKKLLWDLFDSRVCFLHTALLQPISKFPASKSYLTFIRQEKSRQKKKKVGKYDPGQDVQKILRSKHVSGQTI